ncbi:MAG: ABC transporter permease [Armatimonadota bacterium]|nr:ABC transporter permease [Armatimonadota bacterium]MDR7532026.1 ABC transporter permease [Armatimonadota bacterium]MDR7535957.1 ABC transporter permease [Armatimonadota bacterium]
MSPDGRDRLLAVGAPAALVVLWEAAVATRVLDPRFFPPPSLVVLTLARLVADGTLVQHTLVSVARVLGGFAIGGGAGLLLGLLLGVARPLRVALDPVISALYVIPKVAILPLVMLIFGLGEAAKVAIVAIATFFVVVINTTAAVIGIEPIYLEAGRAFGARGAGMFAHIVLPGALPAIFTGLRLALGTALIVVIAAEFVAAKEGIGYFIWFAWNTLRPEAMFAGFIVIGALGMLSYAAVHWAGARLMPWREDGPAHEGRAEGA